MSEAKDFLKEKWAILESERIRKKRKRKAVITVFGIIGAYVGGTIGSFLGILLIIPMMVKESTVNIIRMTVLIFPIIVAGLVVGTILGVSKAKINQSLSGKKRLYVILICGTTIALILAIIMIIRIRNHKNQSITVYKKTVRSQANKSAIESTGNQNKKQQSKDNYEPKTSIPAPQAKLTKKMQNIPAFQIKHERRRYRDKIYYTAYDAKVRFLDNDSLEILIKGDRVTINCTWSSNDHAYVGTWRRDIRKRGPVSKLLLEKRHDDRRMQGKVKLFPRYDSNNEIKCFYGYIMSYNAYISLIHTWSYGNDYSGTPIRIVPTFGCNCPDPEGD